MYLFSIKNVSNTFPKKYRNLFFRADIKGSEGEDDQGKQDACKCVIQTKHSCI